MVARILNLDWAKNPKSKRTLTLPSVLESECKPRMVDFKVKKYPNYIANVKLELKILEVTLREYR